MATGGFCLTATDLSLPDLIDESFSYSEFIIRWFPNSRRSGQKLDAWPGKQAVYPKRKKGCIDAICVDGHAERFSFEDGIWKESKAG